MNQHQPESKARVSDEKMPFWRVVLSVMQASFGVQSNKNRERDFGQKSLVPFIVAALLFTAAFVTILLLIVHWVV